MARPREFDTDAVIHAAMDVFWTHGYEDASLAHLLKGTGLSRGSLYKAFEGKQLLFIQALQHYAELEVWPAVAMLGDTGGVDGLERIAQVFYSIPQEIRSGDSRGCLLCSAAAGRAAHETDVAGLIQGMLASLTQAFGAALSHAGQPDDGTAHLLMSHYVGLRTLQRSGALAEDVESNITALLKLLRP